MSQPNKEIYMKSKIVSLMIISTAALFSDELVAKQIRVQVQYYVQSNYPWNAPISSLYIDQDDINSPKTVEDLVYLLQKRSADAYSNVSNQEKTVLKIEFWNRNKFEDLKTSNYGQSVGILECYYDVLKQNMIIIKVQLDFDKELVAHLNK